MQASADIRALVSSIYDRWSNGDASWVNEILASDDDCLLVGTDPDERWQGRDNIVKIWTKQIEEMGGIKLAAGDLVAFEDGPMGWAFDSPTLRMPDGTEASMRLTFVFRTEGGAWRLVHAHASVGVANEEAIGQELTTSPD
jgi:ketosteroid isomerase-like protein